MNCMKDNTKIWIFGDSFASNHMPTAWPNLFPSEYDIKNYASNGSSEYRIWKNYKLHSNKISVDDIVIFVHTSPYRIFLQDSSSMSSRQLSSHTTCDLIFNDIFSKEEKPFLNILKTIWDDDYFLDIFELIVDDLLRVPNSMHFTFFDSQKIDNFYDIWQSNKGNINHMNENGNNIIFKKIQKHVN